MPCCDTGRNIQKYKGSAASTLQDVTDNSNTTTGDIITTGGFFIGDGSKLTNVPGVSGAAFTLQDTTAKGSTTTHVVEFRNEITSFITVGNVIIGSNVTAAYFYGDGGLLSNTSSLPSLQTVTTVGNSTTNTIEFQNDVTSLITSGNVVVSGNVTAAYFYGDGTLLTGIALNTDLVSNVLRIKNLESNLSSNATRITNLESNLSSNATRITNLESNLSSNATRITNLESNVIRITNLESNLSSNSTRIGTVSTDLASNVLRIINLGSNLSSNATRITNLESNLIRITNLESNLSSNATRITNLESNLLSNATRIKNLESNLTSNSTRITNLESNLIRITNLESNLSSNSERIDTLETEVRPAIRGGTGISSYTTGDILYASSSTQLSKLEPGTTGDFLQTKGTGNAPTWTSAATIGSTTPSNLYTDDYLTGGPWNGQTDANIRVFASVTNVSNKLVARDSNGDIFVSGVYGSIKGSNTISASTISGSTGLYGKIVGSNTISGSIITGSSGLYGTIAGSNTINGSVITGSSGLYGKIVGSNTISGSIISGSTGLYGTIAGSNTINAGTISTVSGIFGPIKGSNTISASTIYSTNFYGKILGSNTISASTIYSTDFYGKILGSNTINAGTISTVSGVYGPIKGSNTITASSIVSDNAVGLNQLNASNIKSGTLSNIYGGTGFTTYSQGDLLVGTGSSPNGLSKLTIGSTNQILTVIGGVPSWQPGSAEITLNNVVNVSNITSNVVQFTGDDYDTSFVTSKKVGIANTSPVHTLDIGTVVSIFQTTTGDVLIVRGNGYFDNEVYISKRLVVPVGGEIVADTIRCRSLSQKGATVVAERLVDTISEV